MKKKARITGGRQQGTHITRLSMEQERQSHTGTSQAAFSFDSGMQRTPADGQGKGQLPPGITDSKRTAERGHRKCAM